MNLIPKTTPEVTAAQSIVDRIIDDLNAELLRRVSVHKRNFSGFWDESPTPDELLEAMGDKAQTILSVAGENVDHIQRLAAILGLTLADLLPAEYWQPRRAFVPGPNGTLTLAPPAEGYDAWGRLIPVPEPIIEPEPVEPNE